MRPLFADLLRAVGAVDGHPPGPVHRPHPKDMRPETFAAMAETPAVCEHLHYPLQSGSDRVLAAMHRGYTAERYLDRLAEARRVVPDLAVSTDIIVGFPGETDDDFARHARPSPPRPSTTTPSRSSSRPVPAPRPPTMVDRFVDPAVAGERFDRLRIVIERSSLAANQARIGRVEEVLVEGPSKKDPTVLAARTPQNKLVHFRSAAPLRAGTYATVEITGAAPHHLTGELRRGARRADPPHAHPRRRRCDMTARSGGRRWARRRRASRDVAMAAALAVPGTEIVAVDAMQVYRGMDIGTAKPTAADQAAVRHHGIDLVEPTVDFTVDRVPARRTTRRWRRSPAARCSSPAPGSTSPPCSTASPCRASGPRCAPPRRRARRRRAVRRRLDALDPVAAGRIEPGNRRRIVRALEVTEGSGRPFSSFGPGLQAYPPTDAVQIGLRWSRPALADARRAAGARR